MSLRRILALLAFVVLVVILSDVVGEKNSADPAGTGAAAPARLAPLPEAGPGPEAPPYPDPATAQALFDWVAGRARARSTAPYQPPDETLPGALARLDYDAYGQIRYRPELALWRGETPFEVQLFHRGSIQSDRVDLHVVEDGTVRTVPFDAARFRYDGEAAEVAGDAGPGLGYAGFRIHYPLNRPDVADEVVVFLGASYFRLLGPGHAHGLSTRGLAVDVAGPEGEEFPDFRAFWLLRPGADARTLTILALLDSPSVTGAYRFDLTPGRGWSGDGGSEGLEPTVVEVASRLFARRDVAKLGVAPLTSMFLHGPQRAGEFDDFRSRVHDSQGLLVQGGDGGWTWRPLTNGPGLRVTYLRDPAPRGAPRGFGLAQRERRFEQYLDLQARYHRRPSEWVEIVDGDWGTGRVELVEIPTVSEFNDNIVASWVPDTPFRAGDERRYAYRIRTFDDRLPGEEGLRVVRARTGWDALPGEVDPPPRTRRRFVVDFAGTEPPPAGDAGGQEVDGGPPEPVLESSSGQVSDLHLLALPDGEGWRASFRLETEEDADLRLVLRRGQRPVSETWRYLWRPERVR